MAVVLCVSAVVISCFSTVSSVCFGVTAVSFFPFGTSTVFFLVVTAAVVLWVGGEILLGLVLDLGLTVSRIWAIAIIVLTCAFSLWKCPRE